MFQMGVKKKVVLLTWILGHLVEQPTPEVHISQGTLRGRVSADGQMFEYLGIPYSTANITNRYKAPFPPPKWDGVFDACNGHIQCPQRIDHGPTIPGGDENCLKINVFTPSFNPSSEPLPVMVFIHGGGFVEGSSNKLLYNPEEFIKRGVIFVSFNYRLGALGFLCLGIEGAPGNAGLKDQLAALRWINANIKAFGGDADNVTIFGESAGAASVSHLRLSRHSNGLFKRVIMQSGSSIPIWAITGDPIGLASKRVEDLGYYTKDPIDLLQIYNNVTIKSLIELKTPKTIGSVVVTPMWFIPCIEKEIEGVERIIEESPYERLLTGKYNNVPAIHGFNDKEAVFLIAKENDITLSEKNSIDNLPSDITFDIDRENIAKTLRQLYFGDKSVNTETLMDLADVYSDSHFKIPTILESEIVSRRFSVPQYNYIFKYNGFRNLLKFICGFPLLTGAVHADELFYMFNTKLNPLPVLGQDAVIMDRLTTMWTNFAKYGDPTPTTSELLPVKWTASDSRGLNFLTIDTDLSVAPLEMTDRLKFWNETYTKHRRKYYEVGLNTPKEFYWGL